MSQGLRDLLANRRFAIPLIVLLAFCFVGLILVGVVLIMGIGKPSGETPVAAVTLTASAVATNTPPSPPTSVPTNTALPKPTATFVPVGTPGEGGAGQTTPGATTAVTGGPTSTAKVGAVTTTASPSGAGATEQATPSAEDEELAQTGAGWGLVIGASIGLAILVVAARRLRLAN